MSTSENPNSRRNPRSEQRSERRSEQRSEHRSEHRSEQRREQRRKQREKELRKRLILAGGIAIAVLLVIILLISILKKKSKDPAEQIQNTENQQSLTAEEATGGQAEGQPAATDAAATDTAAAELHQAEAEDGTGNAGFVPMAESMLAATTEPGFVTDGYNTWYTPDMANCYCNGWQTIGADTYHFNAGGLVDYGWTLIGGQGYYFDDNGVYHPDADPNRLLAFTFDDGPSQGMDELLELCEETGARITFFMIGAQVEGGGAVIPHIIKDRCEVGNHSNTHTQMTKLSTEECAQNFADCDNHIFSFTGGVVSDVVRFPYGDATPEEAAAVGKPAINWSVDSLDWELLEAQPVIDTVLSQITEGDIILMHDRYESTVEACRYLFPYLISQGYQLVTVKELAAAKGFELEAGKTYYGFCQEYIEENRVWE